MNFNKSDLRIQTAEEHLSATLRTARPTLTPDFGKLVGNWKQYSQLH
jgi:hypothetical protein